MKRLIALFAALVVSVAGAQTVQTTPNLITSGTSHTWSGVQTGTVPANYMPGGPTPKYDPATNTVYFSYNSNAYVGQVMQVNQALANAGAGVKINGYTYSYEVRNMNGDDRQPGVDTFTVATVLRGPNNSSLLSSNQYFNTKFDWTTYTGTKTATTPYNMDQVTYLQIGVTGGDNGYWGGYFGPQIRNVDMRLKYSIDPCVANPAYSPTCANYNTVQTSAPILSDVVGRSYAINQALALSGSGVMIHAFNYGYDYSIGDRYCAGWQFLGCWGWADSNATVNVGLSASDGSSLYSNSHYHSGQNISGSPSYRYLFPSSRNLSTLGNVSFSVTTTGVASVSNVWSTFEYTPDPCTVNPLSSTTCAGYQQAYHDQQCSINPLYAVDCAGYQAAYLTQQCNANSLYSQSCPGYQQAYLTQQCSISALYSTQCTGYAVAYHDQQCSLNALYMSDCTGYQEAYFSQQCTANTLYNSQCPGYAVAYKNQQCSLNSLYASDCPGYAVAYHDSQCTANPLYMNDCSGYQAAYLTQQCNISQLYSTSCPNYQQAYFAQQCQLNGLYDRTCPNYATAYAAKNILSVPKTTTSVVTIATESTATVTSNPAAVAISDPVVSSAVSTPSTTSSTSPTSVTSVINAPSNSATTTAATAASNPPPAPAPSSAAKADAKKTEGAVARAAARGNAAAAAKEAAEKSANATTMEAQTATQGLVVGLMGYVPGFSAYQNAIVPDTLANAVARQYHKPTVDNRNAQRRLTGASDARWQEMVDSQYKLGDR